MICQIGLKNLSLFHSGLHFQADHITSTSARKCPGGFVKSQNLIRTLLPEYATLNEAVPSKSF